MFHSSLCTVGSGRMRDCVSFWIKPKSFILTHGIFHFSCFNGLFEEMSNKMLPEIKTVGIFFSSVEDHLIKIHDLFS